MKKMAVPWNDCSCTQDKDCDFCREHEKRGFEFHETNGDKGISILIKERNMLYAEVERLKELINRNKSYSKVVEMQTEIYDLRDKLAARLEEK
jgi:hypothetical protein